MTSGFGSGPITEFGADVRGVEEKLYRLYPSPVSWVKRIDFSTGKAAFATDPAEIVDHHQGEGGQREADDAAPLGVRLLRGLEHHPFSTTLAYSDSPCTVEPTGI